MAVSGISGIFGEVRATCHTTGKMHTFWLACVITDLFLFPQHVPGNAQLPSASQKSRIVFASPYLPISPVYGPHPRPQLFKRTHPSCLSTQDFNLLARGCGWGVRIPAKGSQANELTYCASMSSIHVRINHCSGHHKPAILRFVVSRVLVDNSKPCRRDYSTVDAWRWASIQRKHS